MKYKYKSLSSGARGEGTSEKQVLTPEREIKAAAIVACWDRSKCKPRAPDGKSSLTIKDTLTRLL